MIMDQLEKICTGRGISLRQLGLAAGITTGTFTGWKRGAKPNNTNLKKIADHFGVTVEWLLSDEDLPTKWEPVVESDAFLPLSSREKQILEMYRELSEMGRLTVDTTILRVWNDER